MLVDVDTDSPVKEKVRIKWVNCFRRLEALKSLINRATDNNGGAMVRPSARLNTKLRIAFDHRPAAGVVTLKF